jgi:hypothetical protein
MSEPIRRTKCRPRQIERPKPRHQLPQSPGRSCSRSSRGRRIRSGSSSRSRLTRQFAIRLRGANILATCVAHTDSQPVFILALCHVAAGAHEKPTMRLTPSMMSISPLFGQYGPLLQNAGQTCVTILSLTSYGRGTTR